MFLNANNNNRIYFNGSIDIRKVNARYPLKYKGYIVLNNAVVSNGKLTFASKDHADKFFSILSKKVSVKGVSDNIRPLYYELLSKYDKYNLYVDISNISHDSPRIRRYLMALHKRTSPKNVVRFPYLGSKSFKDWPPHEQRRFANFCKLHMSEKEYYAFSGKVFGTKVSLGTWDKFTVALAEWNVINPGKLSGEIRKNVVVGPKLNDPVALSKWIIPYTDKIAKNKLTVVTLSLDGGRVGIIPNKVSSKLYTKQVNARYKLYSWTDNTFTPEKIANINFIEHGFSNLDMAIIPGLSKINNKTGRLSLLGIYGTIMFLRNLPNPISWYTFLCSITRLDLDVKEMVHVWNYGTDDERALLTGQIVGMVYGVRCMKMAHKFFAENKITVSKGKVRIIARKTSSSSKAVSKVKETKKSPKGPNKPSGGSKVTKIKTRPNTQVRKPETMAAKQGEPFVEKFKRGLDNTAKQFNQGVQNMFGPKYSPAGAGRGVIAGDIRKPVGRRLVDSGNVMFAEGRASEGIAYSDVIKAVIEADLNMTETIKILRSKYPKMRFTSQIERLVKKMKKMSDTDLEEIAVEANIALNKIKETLKKDTDMKQEVRAAFEIKERADRIGVLFSMLKTRRTSAFVDIELNLGVNELKAVICRIASSGDKTLQLYAKDLTGRLRSKVTVADIREVIERENVKKYFTRRSDIINKNLEITREQHRIAILKSLIETDRAGGDAFIEAKGVSDSSINSNLNERSMWGGKIRPKLNWPEELLEDCYSDLWGRNFKYYAEELSRELGYKVTVEDLKRVLSIENIELYYEKISEMKFFKKQIKILKSLIENNGDENLAAEKVDIAVITILNISREIIKLSDDALRPFAEELSNRLGYEVTVADIRRSLPEIHKSPKASVINKERAIELLKERIPVFIEAGGDKGLVAENLGISREGVYSYLYQLKNLPLEEMPKERVLIEWILDVYSDKGNFADLETLESLIANRQSKYTINLKKRKSLESLSYSQLALYAKVLSDRLGREVTADEVRSAYEISKGKKFKRPVGFEDYMLKIYDKISTHSNEGEVQLLKTQLYAIKGFFDRSDSRVKKSLLADLKNISEADSVDKAVILSKQLIEKAEKFSGM
ncbi:MAG: hypothetical protein ABIH00_01225 [Armatimonadota bacterium]